MIDIIYNGKQIKLNSNPKDGAFVNDDFLDELDAVDNNAFTVSIVDSEIVITHTGLALNEVDLKVGCNVVPKTCE